MRRDHAGNGLFSLGASWTRPGPCGATVRKGRAKAAINGQRANGLRRLFKTRTSRILNVLGNIREKSIDKAPSLGIGRSVFGLLYPRVSGEGTRIEWVKSAGYCLKKLSVSL